MAKKKSTTKQLSPEAAQVALAKYESMFAEIDGEQEEDLPELCYRVGKKAAGRLLDDRTWDQMPEVSHAGT